MFVLNSISIVVVLIVLGMILFRLLVQYQINKVKKSGEHSPEFQRKFQIYEQHARRQHLGILLGATFLVGVTLVLLTLSLLLVEDRATRLEQQATRLAEDMQKVRHQQQELISSISIRPYPKEGIGLAELAWSDLFEKDEDKELQTRMETTVSQKLTPYFGLSQTILSIEAATKTVSLSLSETTENEGNEAAMKENIQALLRELEKISQVTQVHIQVVVATKEKPLYEETYLREDGQTAFQLKEKGEKDQ